MLRISAGLLKGLSLTVPIEIRPTEGKVRQALFNILGERVAGARVIDGGAGSGAIGIEALSRGAAEVVFLESDPACVRAIETNLAKIRPGAVPGRWKVVPGDMIASLERMDRRRLVGPFDVLLFDPPYRRDWEKKILNVVEARGMLSPVGLVCIEHAVQTQVPDAVGTVTLTTQHRYGETVLSFYMPVPAT